MRRKSPHPRIRWSTEILEDLVSAAERDGFAQAEVSTWHVAKLLRFALYNHLRKRKNLLNGPNGGLTFSVDDKRVTLTRNDIEIRRVSDEEIPDYELTVKPSHSRKPNPGKPAEPAFEVIDSLDDLDDLNA